jgi:hypothetical protein
MTGPQGRGLIATLALLSCTAEPPPVQGKFWPASDFFTKPKATFSGFPTARLVSTGGGIPWRTADFGETGVVSDGGWSLAVQPAFQAGDTAAYVVTEIWDTHPDPWVQPVYHVKNGGQLIRGIFGVGVDSTFYSPYWRVYDVAATAPTTSMTTVADVVNSGLPITRQAVWVCPIVPDGVTGFAAVPGGAPVRPLSFEAVSQPDQGVAFADGEQVQYLNFFERQTADVYEEGADGVVDATDFYVFTGPPQADAGRVPLELPAVLADNAAVHSYARRVDVILNGEAIFVPADNAALRAHVQTFVDGSFASAPVPDAVIPADVARKYALRVASDPRCFYADAGSPGFPGACTWLDSEEAIDALPPSRVLDSSVTLTATPVLLGGKPL